MKKQFSKVFHVRQGDVLVRRIVDMPKGAIQKPTEGGRVVIAYGEVTGHAHAIAESEAVEFTFAIAGNVVRRFLQVIAKATIKHEEHSAIELPAGVYEIVQQREYSPQEIRNVQD